VNPKFSVILLTTLIGAGQGLFIAVFVVEVGALFGLLPSPIRPWFYFYGALLTLAFTGAGLAASFFHLGRPARAWRSASQWRTSWLSREVIVLPAFMGAPSSTRSHFFGWNATFASQPGSVADATILLGLVGMLLAFGLYVCTGMIYACLPFLREWATPLTPLNYTMLGLASGFTLAAAATLAPPPLVRLLAAVALVFTLLGLVGRVASLNRNARLRPKSTLQTAIGVNHPRIVQKSQGFIGDSFNAGVLPRPDDGTGRSNGVSVGAFIVPAALLLQGLAGAPRTPSCWRSSCGIYRVTRRTVVLLRAGRIIRRICTTKLLRRSCLSSRGYLNRMAR
jgi:DMSO reductase anchor subunit